MVACNASPARHLCYVNDIMYTLPSQREFGPSVVLENVCRTFSPSPTDRPWVSENALIRRKS